MNLFIQVALGILAIALVATSILLIHSEQKIKQMDEDYETKQLLLIIGGLFLEITLFTVQCLLIKASVLETDFLSMQNLYFGTAAVLINASLIWNNNKRIHNLKLQKQFRTLQKSLAFKEEPLLMAAS